MTKKFITLQMGYSRSELYGLSNEYFTTIIIRGSKIQSISHYGMYGSDERINRALKEKGYTHEYIPSDYGKMPIRKAWKGFISEAQALDLVRYIK